MEAILHGVTGPATSVKAILKHQQAVTVGRTERASLPISQDPALSGVHFGLELRDEQLLLRDLGSSNGTFVNGIRVQHCLLQSGDVISAGQSVFRVEVQQEVLSPLDVLLAEPEPLYAILDAAREPRVLEFLRLSGARHFCLQQGKPGAEMEIVSPYLVPLTPQGSLLPQIVSEGWGKAWGIFLACREPVERVWQQLQRLLVVTLETQEIPVYFRYYDPRVLREFFPIMDGAQLEEFCGPISRFLLEDEEPDGLLRFQKVEGAGKVERITVKPATPSG